MHISVLGGEGLPAKAYISIRVGDTRRQAPFQSREPLRFPGPAEGPKAAAPRSAQVDIFQKLGSTQVSLAGVLAGSGGVHEQDVSVALPDGRNIDLRLGLDLFGSGVEGQRPAEPEAAVCARSYLEDHGVRELLQAMVKSMLAERPEDPAAFMLEYIGRQKRDVRKVTLPQAEVDAVGGDHAEESTPPVNLVPQEREKRAALVRAATTIALAEEEIPGFPVDVALPELPDLSGYCNLLAEVLRSDPAIYDDLRTLRTRQGVSFARVVKPGMDNRGHKMIRPVGLVAGDAECYETFGPLFESVLRLKFPDFAAGGVQPLDLGWERVTSEPLDPEGCYALSVRVRLNRNIAGLPFPPACSRHQRREAERLLSWPLLALEGDLDGNYLPIPGSSSFGPRPGGMSETELTELRGLGAELEEPDSAVAISSGLARHWPEARGVFLASSGRFWAWLNEEDHLKLFAAQPGGDLKEAFARVCRAEKALREALLAEGHEFARSARWGHLASVPTNVGTGLSASVTLRLPLAGSQSGFRGICAGLGLQATQEGNGVWTLANISRLGSSEVEQVSMVISGCHELIAMESRLRMEGGCSPAQTIREGLTPTAASSAVSWALGPSSGNG